MRRVIAAGALVSAACALAACGSGSLPPPKVSKPPITAPQPQSHGALLPWATYGGDNHRTRAVTVRGLRPPFRRLWTFHAHALLELPPVAGYGLLFEESFDGRLRAIDQKTGLVKWTYVSHRCGWSSPGLARGYVYATFIGDSHCSSLPNGEIAAISVRTGRVRWWKNIGPSESSPLVTGGSVYFGDTNGRVYSVNALTGWQRWSFDTGAPVKASPTLWRGHILVGNYGGSFYALDSYNGRVIWKSDGLGNIYSSAAVAYGRAYVGSIAHAVDAFDTRTGAQLWSFPTGSYVYASPAVWRGIVLVGSYDGTFYAINGTTGTLRWEFHAGGPISGAASVIDGVVYFSTLAHKTFALGAASGRLVKEWNDGDYSPAVAGGGRLFLVGLGQIYALAPRG